MAARALLTDLYQLTMAYGYWKTGNQDREARRELATSIEAQPLNLFGPIVPVTLLTWISGPLRRELFMWSARAMSSLPVPVSPVIVTVIFVLTALLISS